METNADQGDSDMLFIFNDLARCGGWKMVEQLVHQGRRGRV